MRCIRSIPDVRSYRDLPPIMCEQIAHFFQHYKDLEKGKWVTIVNWLDADGAEKLVLEAIARAEKAETEGARRPQSCTGARPRNSPPPESAPKRIMWAAVCR